MLTIFLAQGEIHNPALSNTLQSLSGVQFLNLLLPNLITVFFIVAAIAAFFFILIGGIKWITSGGDKAATEAAQKTITAAVIGLVVVFCVYAVIKLIENLLGVNLTLIDFSQLSLE